MLSFVRSSLRSLIASVVLASGFVVLTASPASADTPVCPGYGTRLVKQETPLGFWVHALAGSETFDDGSGVPRSSTYFCMALTYSSAYHPTYYTDSSEYMEVSLEIYQRGYGSSREAMACVAVWMQAGYNPTTLFASDSYNKKCSGYSPAADPTSPAMTWVSFILGLVPDTPDPNPIISQGFALISYAQSLVGDALEELPVPGIETVPVGGIPGSPTEQADATVTQWAPTGGVPDVSPDDLLSINASGWGYVYPHRTVAGGAVYPLRHSYSLTPSHYAAPESCAQLTVGYHCSAIYGFEGIGDNRNWFISRSSIKAESKGMSDGREIVSTGGHVYQGCYRYTATLNWCDFYRGKDSNSRQCCQSGSGFWLKVLREWSSNIGQQAACAVAIIESWGGVADWVAIGDACANEPYE